MSSVSPAAANKPCPIAIAEGGRSAPLNRITAMVRPPMAASAKSTAAVVIIVCAFIGCQSLQVPTRDYALRRCLHLTLSGCSAQFDLTDSSAFGVVLDL